METCKICNLETQTKRGLSYHISQTHKVQYKQYYDLYLKTENEGKCKICGEQTKFKVKYNTYCSKKCIPQDLEIIEQRKKKSIETCLEKYGTEWNSQSKEHREKCSITWKSFSNKKRKSISKKKKQTSLEKYGVDNPAKTEKLRKQVSETHINKTKEEKEIILEKRKKTCLEKYGVDCVWKSRKIIDLIKVAKLEKYGSLFVGKLSSYSKISQELFREIEIKEHDNYYATKNKEFRIVNEFKKSYFFDFTDHTSKKIIEFNGSAFHPYNNILDEDDTWHAFKKIKAKDAREYERIKVEEANKNGYDVLIVFDVDYKQNRELVINKCKEFLK
jgi:hypothetical protein